MRQMKGGQRAFFYHSNCKDPGVAGLMKVSHPPHHKQTNEPVGLPEVHLCPGPDSEGGVCGPHSVWQERSPLWCSQQAKQSQVEHGKKKNPVSEDEVARLISGSCFRWTFNIKGCCCVFSRCPSWRSTTCSIGTAEDRWRAWPFLPNRGCRFNPSPLVCGNPLLLFAVVS